MTIGIVAYINPAEFCDYLQKEQSIPNINKAASAVNAITLGLLKAGHRIIAISSYDEKGPVIHLSGDKLDIYLVSTFSKIPKAITFKRWYMVRRIQYLLADHVSEMDIIHTHWTYDFALASAAFAKAKPVFCTIRDWAPIIRKHEDNIKAKLMWWIVSESLFKKVIRNRNVHLIANSLYISELLRSHYPNRTCDIIGNPIQNKLIIKHRNNYPDHPVFISIAQDITDSRKNCETLLKAFHILLKSFPDAELLLIGERREAIYKKWEQAGLSKNVKYLGFVDHRALIDFLDNASALVHPSLEESFGNTLLEGMARRIPVIGGEKSGAVPFVLGNGKYGLLCDATSPLDMAKCMQKALNIDEMKSMLDRATSYLYSELTNDIIAEKHISLFSKHLSRL